MRGLVFEGVGRIGFHRDLPDPTIEESTDAIVRITRTGLCGSDLHPYEGREPLRVGVVPGHEAVGEVVAVGAGVEDVDVGRRVLVPFTTSCGACRACRDGLSARCGRGGPFGYADPADPAAPALHGAQAEYLRVPLADGTLVGVPDHLDDESAVLLTDNLPTGWVAATRAGVEPGSSIALVGLGSVGLCALFAARALGAASIVAIDPVESRRGSAAVLGAQRHVAPPEAYDAVEAQTAGVGVDAAIDASGTPAGQALAAALVRPGGILSIIAVQTDASFAFTPIEAYDRNLTIRVGRAPVRSVLDDLLPRFASGALSVPTTVISTHGGVALADGPDLYRRFAAREPGMVKASMIP